MPATTINLPQELKERIATLIQGSGTSMHAFLLESIERQTEQSERRKAFVDDAVSARTETLTSGRGIPAQEAHAFLRARASGKKVAPPKARAWRR